ncbi:MAG: helix-turn-helix domain-containing protein [Subdoligranulum sp.]|nr:helix-turn-helix domain-containing protein [Subdoligranulum sp.]MBD5101609.1 helix-turn-helix domain-containing protein [Subdoligranulum sp.]
MDNNLLGEQIAQYRKAAGLTQDELGKAVGISAQAVSRWECGGAPDITLLPDIAERLGVSIDALFGREKGEQADVEDTVRRWIASVPKGQRLNELCRLVWSAMGPVVLLEGRDYKTAPKFNRESRCEWIDEADGKPYPVLRRISVFQEDGLVFGVNADDMSFVSIWPEPEAGYEAFMTKNSLCRELFQVLAMPHCLELLEYLHSKPARDFRHYTPGAVAKALGIEVQETENLIAALTDLGLLKPATLETEDGVCHSFRTWGYDAIVPLLYFARWLTSGGTPPTTTAGRTAPVLRREKWKENEED